MMTFLPQDLINELIAIGAHEDISKIRAIPRKYPGARSGQFMRERPKFWNDIAAQLTDDDLVSLIKALTLAERELINYKSGSVSPVIYLFRTLQARKQPAELHSLEDWIISNTDNPYLPWGSCRIC